MSMRERIARALFNVRDDEFDTDAWEDLDAVGRERWLCYADAISAEFYITVKPVTNRTNGDPRESVSRIWQTADRTNGSLVHACPVNGAGVTGCCGRTLYELPVTDRVTQNRHQVTCTNRTVGLEER